jgi:hypothetical protein
MNKNCLISTIAKPSMHRHWLYGERNYDCYFTTYRKTDFCIYELDGELVTLSETENRFTHYFDMLQTISVKPYEYYFFIDCNLSISPKQINQLFESMNAFKLEGCMPALSRENYILPEHLSREDRVLHYVNYLDTRCFALSHQAVSEILNTFKTKEIAGIEAEWFKLLGEPNNKLAVIDMILAEFKTTNGIDTEAYARLLQSENYKPHTFGGIDLENNLIRTPDEKLKRRHNPNPSPKRLKKLKKKVKKPTNPF